MNILGAHIDSPRMDLKQNPLYEESGFAYFDTHYYGGIKKPVGDAAAGNSRHNREKDGTKVDISIGERKKTRYL